MLTWFQSYYANAHSGRELLRSLDQRPQRIGELKNPQRSRVADHTRASRPAPNLPSRATCVRQEGGGYRASDALEATAKSSTFPGPFRCRPARRCTHRTSTRIDAIE